MSTLATILEIQRMSTEDGPGIRTTVFFKGCPLACSWCHNPESISPAPEVVWHGWRCIGCGTCVETCPEGARFLGSGGVEVDRSRCTDCGRCIDECPACAIERLGRAMSLDDVVEEVVKDRLYYDASGGGVTLSGGEPLLQRQFAQALLERCRSLGLHAALDTSGMCSWAALRALAGVSDLILFDVKALDPRLHEAHTGSRNTVILKNLRRLAGEIRAGDVATTLWIRTPLIPGATATTENLEAIGAFLASELDGVVARWDLCTFNNLCKDKYERLGKRWAFEATELLDEEALESLSEAARRSGVPVDVIRVSGLTRVADGKRPSQGNGRPPEPCGEVTS